MAKKIVWTKRALKNLDKTITYLQENWSEKVIDSFVTKTYETLYLLCEFPEIGVTENRNKNIRGLLITRHNKLFYKITKDSIVVLRIVDTRQNPNRLKP